MARRVNPAQAAARAKARQEQALKNAGVTNLEELAQKREQVRKETRAKTAEVKKGIQEVKSNRSFADTLNAGELVEKGTGQNVTPAAAKEHRKSHEAIIAAAERGVNSKGTPLNPISPNLLHSSYLASVMEEIQPRAKLSRATRGTASVSREVENHIIDADLSISAHQHAHVRGDSDAAVNHLVDAAGHLNSAINAAKKLKTNVFSDRFGRTDDPNTSYEPEISISGNLQSRIKDTVSAYTQHLESVGRPASPEVASAARGLTFAEPVEPVKAPVVSRGDVDKINRGISKTRLAPAEVVARRAERDAANPRPERSAREVLPKLVGRTQNPGVSILEHQNVLHKAVNHWLTANPTATARDAQFSDVARDPYKYAQDNGLETPTIAAPKEKDIVQGTTVHRGVRDPKFRANPMQDINKDLGDAPVHISEEDSYEPEQHHNPEDLRPITGTPQARLGLGVEPVGRFAHFSAGRGA